MLSFNCFWGGREYLFTFIFSDEIVYCVMIEPQSRPALEEILKGILGVKREAMPRIF